jgi:flagellar hook assembly protein FlgD
VYDAVGAVIKALVEGGMDAGVYEVQWDGTSDDGDGVGNGIYFCNLRAGDFVQTRKLVLLK